MRHRILSWFQENARRFGFARRRGRNRPVATACRCAWRTRHHV